MISIDAIGSQAIEYARTSLRDGLSLARMSVSALDGMMAVALVPDGTSAERALDFKRGGLGRCDVGQIAALLSQEYPGTVMVVELPLWRPEDLRSSDADLGVITCDTEVYAARYLGDSLKGVEETLRLADPSFMYNAFILEYEVNSEARPCPPDLINSGSGEVKAVLVGAYDGEGFVFARARDVVR